MTPNNNQAAAPLGRSADQGSKYNNFAICALGIMASLQKAPSQRMSLPKALLVMPFIMHDASVRFLGKSNTKPRQISALIASRPELFLNFNSRFLAGLTPTLNAIQFLNAANFIHFDGQLHLSRELNPSSELGLRAGRILKATDNIVAALSSSEEELYLNLRIEL